MLKQADGGAMAHYYLAKCHFARQEYREAIDSYKAAGKAIRRARAGKGPTLLEFKIHQLEGNLEGRLEANEKERQWDPIDHLKQKIPRKLDEQIRAEEAARVQKAVEFGLKSPEPTPDQAYTCVYKEVD